jgi:hypothetical protein
MPDRRKHRGAHPEDVRLFSAEAEPTLQAAVVDFCWLLDRDYPHDSSLKLVGDRCGLAARQRTAVSRCCCSNAAAVGRREREVAAEQLLGRALWLDGYNVLTTVEAALAGGVILAARDGAYRDMASMHGSYRKVTETVDALDLLGRTIDALAPAECRWFFDQPVSNSGRLKALMNQMSVDRGWQWQIELTPNPDAVLINAPPDVVAATADSAILDRCPGWLNLARETITRHVPDAWICLRWGHY